MTRYWAMRTDRDENDFIFQELKKGRLRQGWGWKKNLDLNIIRGYVAKGEESKLDEDQEDVWRRQRRMHPKEEDGIREGDYIILPNLPDVGQWSIARVVGGYRYEINPKLKNYGHILEVTLLNLNNPINPYNEYVSAELRKTMTCRGRLWNIDDYKGSVEKLISAIKNKEKITKPTTEDKQILHIYSEVSNTLDKEIKHQFHGSEFENPVEKLLEKIYQNVEKRAGSREKGADFICDFTDGLSVPYRVVVQVKMWEGEADWKRPLEQIKQAYNNYENISAGVIITTSDSSSEEFDNYKRKLEKELKIPIVLVNKQDLMNVLLKHLPELIEINE